MKLADIYEGWKNNLFPPEKLKEAITEMSEQRMEICNACPHISTKHNTPLRPDVHCIKCGCTLAAKTKVFSTHCPINKWKAVLTAAQQQEINGTTESQTT